jgi:rhamnosyltransferase
MGSVLIQLNPTIASITVAMNGSGILGDHLRALSAQSRVIDEMIVVDNASTDGTATSVLHDFPSITLVPMRENVGVGGGYAAGLEYALRKGHHWFWLFDQDSVPAANALEELLGALRTLHEAGSSIGILACLPVDPQTGREYPGEVWRNRLVVVGPQQAKQEVYFVDSVVSSGSLVCRRAVEAGGLPRRDFFMDFVDHEYNLRLRRLGYQVAVVRKSLLYHRLGRPALVKRWLARPRLRNYQPDWRHYYMSRNETYTVWHLFGTSISRLFLLGRLLRRVAGLVVFDQNRWAKVRMVIVGFRDGVEKNLGKRYEPHSTA